MTIISSVSIKFSENEEPQGEQKSKKNYTF